jgi:hypothetical protein
MGQYEDLFYEIYDEVTNNNLNEEFNMQLSKMEFQDKHKHKSVKEKWEYALNRIKENIQKKPLN